MAFVVCGCRENAAGLLESSRDPFGYASYVAALQGNSGVAG
jgi:hypothetical protein